MPTGTLFTKRNENRAWSQVTIVPTLPSVSRFKNKPLHKRMQSINVFHQIFTSLTGNIALMPSKILFFLVALFVHRRIKFLKNKCITYSPFNDVDLLPGNKHQRKFYSYITELFFLGQTRPCNTYLPLFNDAKGLLLKFLNYQTISNLLCKL